MRTLPCHALLVACIVTTGCSRQSKPDEVDPMVVVRNFSLRGFGWDDESAWPLEGALCRLFPERNGKSEVCRPTCVLAFGSIDEPTLFLVIEPYGINLNPGNNLIRLTLLDDLGKMRASAICLVCGMFIYAHHHFVEGFDLPVIAIESIRHQPPYQTHWYAINENRFDLIRIDDPEWGENCNNYHDGHRFFGPKPPQQSAEEWEADLCSNDRTRVLRALVWIGGDHGIKGSHDPRKGRGEDPVESALAWNVRARPAVQVRVRELAKSNEQWEREAATSMLPLVERP